MKKELLLIGISFIFFGIYIFSHDYIYDSSFGAYIDVASVKYLLGVGLIAFGIISLYSVRKKNS